MSIKDLDKLMLKALTSYERMTPLERLRHDESQRNCFAMGNLNASTNHGGKTMKQMRRVALGMWLDDLSADSVESWPAAVRLTKAIHKLEWRLYVMGVVDSYSGPEGGK